MPRRADDLAKKTTEAFARVKVELDAASQKLDRRIEAMKEKLERRREPRVQLRVGGAR